MENIAFILIIIIHIVAIIVSIYLVNVERKYCKHCEWWNEVGAFIVIVLSFVPILGIVVPRGVFKTIFRILLGIMGLSES